MSRVVSIERAFRARAFAQANRLGSIVWGTRRGLGTVLDMRPPIVSPLNASTGIVMGPISQEPGPQPAPFPGNPDTQPGAWPGLTLNPPSQEPPPPVLQASGSPGQVPVVVTPTSGPIPSPGTVAAATAPTSWLDESLIGGIPNKYLLLGGLGAFLIFGGKHK